MGVMLPSWCMDLGKTPVESWRYHKRVRSARALAHPRGVHCLAPRAYPPHVYFSFRLHLLSVAGITYSDPANNPRLPPAGFATH